MALPKWMTDEGSGPAARKKKSVKQEKKSAIVYGGKEIAGSGSSHFQKGDIRTPEFRMECKRTDADSIILKKSWLRKIDREAADVRKRPAVELEISGDFYVVLRREDFLDYLSHIREIKN